MVDVKEIQKGNYKAFWEKRCQNFFNHCERKVIQKGNSEAFWGTRCQNFLNHGERKEIQKGNCKAFRGQDVKISSTMIKVKTKV